MEVKYELMRPDEIIGALTTTPVIYVPIGPMEWHGPHLPLGVDMLHAYTLATEAARLTGGVVFPPLPLGTETYLSTERVRDRGFVGTERIIGMDFPGFPLRSVYIEESAFGVIIHELIRSIRRQNFRVIALINGHGGRNHLATLDRIAEEASEPPSFRVLHLFSLNLQVGGKRMGGHAERGETAFMLSRYPQTVNLEALPDRTAPLKNTEFGILDGPTCIGMPTPDFTVREDQDPRNATAKEGEEFTVERVQSIVAAVRTVLREIA